MSDLEPNSSLTVGIFGGGQLGRMLAMAAASLGVKAHIYCPQADPPAADCAAHFTQGEYQDRDKIMQFAASCDILTFEFENIIAEFLEPAAALTPLRPSISALRVSQDRWVEKQFLAKQHIPAARSRPISSSQELESSSQELESFSQELKEALAEFGGRGILKTRRFGYDGKGQFMLGQDTDIEQLLAELHDNPVIFEELISFEKEISVIIARNAAGDISVFDIGENIHENHILKRTLVPAELDEELAGQARQIAIRIAESLDYIGVLAVEMFVLGKGARQPILVNELAPRVHNSGHWTLDGCQTSQFEQHIRAICGWPLGGVHRHGAAVMENLIGNDIDQTARLLASPGISVHLYGKNEVRAGRKMGHICRIFDPDGKSARE